MVSLMISVLLNITSDLSMCEQVYFALIVELPLVRTIIVVIIEKRGFQSKMRLCLYIYIYIFSL